MANLLMADMYGHGREELKVVLVLQLSETFIHYLQQMFLRILISNRIPVIN
jgi:hypothetical protein